MGATVSYCCCQLLLTANYPSHHQNLTNKDFKYNNNQLIIWILNNQPALGLAVARMATVIRMKPSSFIFVLMVIMSREGHSCR